MSRRRRTFDELLLSGMAGLFLVLLASPSSAQQLSKRLILKDGSYQLANKWEVNGDRVRYYSSERDDWEEVPNSLVDWPATDKYAADRASGAAAPEAVALDKEIATERAAEEAKRPEVAPGLRLPEDSGVLLLDNYKSQPQLVELQQNAGEVNRNTKSNILHAAINPISGSKQTIELQKPHASIQSHTLQPVFYINISQEQNLAPQMPQGSQSPELPQQPLDRFRIVRVQVKSDKRIVGNIHVNPLGKVSQKEDSIPTDSRSYNNGWLELKPIRPLDPGEYALVEIAGQDEVNLYVWDFGVNIAAAANNLVTVPERSASPAPLKP
jgi:hypothetical protein